jgi:toxin ParE1/3/4
VTIVYTEPAVADLRAIREYLQARQPERAGPALAALRAQIGHLVRFPYLGRPGKRTGTRELVIAGLPYIATYRVREDVIEIIRVRHTSRRR